MAATDIKRGTGSGHVRWGVVDQAVSSATNALLSVMVARQASAVGFGAFGIAYTVYLFSLGFTRAVAAEPLLIRRPAAVRSDPSGDGAAVGGVGSAAGVAGVVRGAVGSAAGAAIVIGVLIGLGCAAAAVAIGGQIGAALLPLGIGLPALLVQDVWRFELIAGGRGRDATVNDLVWGVTLVGALAIAPKASEAGLAPLVVAWVGTGALAAVLGAWQTSAVPAPMRARRWLREQRDLIPHLVLEFLARTGGRQLTVFAVGLVSGLAALGAIRAAEVVFGPLNVILLGANVSAVPHIASVLRRAPGDLAAAARRLSLQLAGLALAVGALSLAIPTSLGRTILGASWSVAAPVLIPQALLMAGNAANTGPLAGLRALEQVARSARVRMLLSPLSVVVGTVGALAGGAVGATLGLAAVNWLGAGLFWRQFRSATAELDRPRGVGAAAVARPDVG